MTFVFVGSESYQAACPPPADVAAPKSRMIVEEMRVKGGFCDGGAGTRIVGADRRYIDHDVSVGLIKNECLESGRVVTRFGGTALAETILFP